MDPTVLARLEKLFAMANSNSPAEAAIALSKAQAIMEAHNLTMNHVERYKVGQFEFKSTQSVSKVKDWEQGILHVVADAFGCRLLFRPGSSYAKDPFGRFVFVGYKANLELAEYSAIVIMRAVIDGRRRLTQQLVGLHGRQKTVQLDGYCQGFWRMVYNKVAKLAIDPVIDDLVKELTANGKKLETQRRKGGYEGYQQGMADGAAMDLHRPMNAGAQQIKLGRQ